MTTQSVIGGRGRIVAVLVACLLTSVVSLGLLQVAAPTAAAGVTAEYNYDPPSTATTPVCDAADVFALGAVHAPAGESRATVAFWRFCVAAEDADNVTQIVKTRPEPGADGGISNHIIEQQNGETTSVTHQVEVDGEVVHQHQTYIGKYGGQRQFPPGWSQFPDINAP